MGHLFEHLFGTSALVELFSERNFVASMLHVEAALAQTEARAGILSESSAQAICICCQVDQFDLTSLAEAAAVSGNILIPLVKQLMELVRKQAPEAAGYVHWGATSQDVLDTALVMQLRDALDWFAPALDELCDLLAEQTLIHRDTLLAGRTWMQHAVPITFGLRCAGSLDALLRHRARLEEIRPRLLVLQFGGAAGTLASLGVNGEIIARDLSEVLQLGLPDLPWHAHRDRLAEMATALGLLTGTLGKMARDIALGTQTELGETSEGTGRGGSSTMPHKRNPVGAAVVLSAALRVPGLVATMLTAMVQEQERGLGGWHAEWETLPEIVMLAGGALERMKAMVRGLEVYSADMRANLERSRGLLMAESVSMKLAEHVGRNRAHHLLEEASKRVFDQGDTLAGAIAADEAITQHLAAEERERLLDPAMYLGSTGNFIDAVLARHQHGKRTTPEAQHG